MNRFGPRRLGRIARSYLRRASGEMEDRRWKTVDTRLVTVGRGSEGWRSVSWGGSNRVAGDCWFTDEITVGFGTRFGVGCLISGPLIVGRYCSIGGQVSIGAGGHPMETAGLFNAPLIFGGRRRRLGNPDHPAVVGNDVWIGAGARILSGLTIGDGAVIAAGAVVTKDVPAFTVVGGVPARSLRQRFEPAVASLVAEFAWWELDPEQLAGFEEFMELDLTKDTGSAVAALKDAIARRPSLGT